MQEFATEQEALDFLASRIAAEAERENLPLSEVERKMLYFSETGWTLPDMAKVSADFDQDYDQDEYERRIARLIAKITAEHHGHNDEEEEKWDAAVDKLSGSDHYLQVMLHAAHMSRASFLPTFEPPAVRPPHDVPQALSYCIDRHFRHLGFDGDDRLDHRSKTLGVTRLAF